MNDGWFTPAQKSDALVPEAIDRVVIKGEIVTGWITPEKVDSTSKKVKFMYNTHSDLFYIQEEK